MENVFCGDCGAKMILRNSKYGKFWGCSRDPQCQGTHGAHEDGSPLGIPASTETRKARTAAHAAFDQLWKQGTMSRREAYKLLQQLMGKTEAEAHIGSFSKTECEELLNKLKNHINRKPNKKRN